MASWKPVFDAVLDLYDDVSSLLRDLDYQLDRHGYSCLHPHHYGYEGTALLDRPRTWLPTWMSRLYVRHSEQTPRRLLGVALVLHPEGLEVLNPHWVDPHAPIILGSLIRYREPPGDRWEMRDGLLWLRSDAPLDGTVHRVQVPPQLGTGLVEHGDVMALPLERVRTGDDLRSMIIDPLRRLT
ncbi:MAG: hypothetical protein RMK29_20480 [Myxococcales bacterium]|nr:hypothetical protein [Myxococcota bacterium]MDW8284088.1 hypothetical protein [Myxococcales bacterium]